MLGRKRELILFSLLSVVFPKGFSLQRFLMRSTMIAGAIFYLDFCTKREKRGCVEKCFSPLDVRHCARS